MKLKFLTKIGLLLFTLGSTMTSCKSGLQVIQKPDLTQFVDPMIGSSAHGHVFVGANVPFGGIQTGPANFNKGWDWCSSYHYSDSIVKGFVHLNLSGTGCSDLGELLVMPAVGDRKINAGTQDHPEHGYASHYSKSSEHVIPGYYTVKLDRYDIKVELTASERVAIHRYTYPQSSKSRIIIDLREGNDNSVETYLHQVSDTVFEGYRYSRGWAPDEREFFTMVLSKPVSDFIMYDGETEIKGRKGKGKYIKGFLEFSTTKEEVVKIKMGVSPVSMENAMDNINAEISHWDFERVVAQAKDKWNKELSKLTIKTDDEHQKRVFILLYIIQ